MPCDPDKCPARLSLILPDDEDPSVVVNCEKREGHRDYHGVLSGYCWESFCSDRPEPACNASEETP